MPNISPVSFQSPGFDYSADQSAIDRKRKLAEALQAQSMEPLQSQSVPGGWAVPISPLQGVAKLAQAWSSAKTQSRADDEQRALATKAQTELTNVLTQANTAAAGRPARTYEDASGNVDQQPAVAADPMRAATLYMGHPMTAGLGTQMMGQEASRQRLMQALQTQQGVPAAGAAGAGPSAPAGQPAGLGGPAGGVPMAAWLAADPTGAKYMEQLAKDAAEAAKPVVNRGFGIGRMVDGKYVPDQASLDQALALERGKQGIHAPMEPPITLKLSGGQEVQLSRPEYADFQKTGQLPARYGQQQPQTPPQAAPQPAQPLPANVPPEHAGAYQTVLDASRKGITASATAPAAAPSLGTPGLSQPQEDQIRQAREQAGGKAADEAFAKDYVQFKTGGAQDATKQIAQLQDVAKSLANPASELTGPLRGRLPDAVRSVTNPNAIAMRERVEEVVQRSLRAILGAQFTEKEGERLIARAYNPTLSQEENAIRVGRLLTQLEAGYKAKADAADYFEKNGTLSGWQGKLPALSDFDPEAGGNLVKDIVGSGAKSVTKAVKWSDLK